jgi:orotidine-5'-phosphate decarboxylase
MDQLLIALDVDSAAEARLLAGRLRGIAGGFKIGSRLFTTEGPRIVEELVSHGDRVFLDLKYHDIPSTVAGAVAAATRLGVWMVDVHASGGSVMMRAAKEAAEREAERLNRPVPLVVAVTLLTSLDETAIAEVGLAGPVAARVQRLAALAAAAGLDGVVASPREIALVRQVTGRQFAVVTPGIRGGAAPPVEGARAGGPGGRDDQSRTMTAAEAIGAGASYLVVGRPITAAADPRNAAERIIAECSPARIP